MNVLIGCEFSGAVRDAFSARGHYAVSCDLLPSETPGHHFQADVFDVLDAFGDQFDLGIFHPPCTDLAVSGARHFAAKVADGRQGRALEFVRRLMRCGLPKWALENPVSVISTAIRRPDQIVQPWWFGHGETKATCLWLSGLPLLFPTCVVSGRAARVHRLPPTADRWKLRSATLPGVAAAMAGQWS